MTRLELIMNDARRPLGPDDVEALLKGVARPEAPGDMVAKVRARLAAERAGAAGEPIAPEPWTLPAASSPSSEAPPKSRFWRYAGEAALAACAIAAVVVGIQLGDDVPRSSSTAAEAAGIAGESAVVDARLVVKGLDEGRVRALAQDAGLTQVNGAEGVSFEGGAGEVRRFLVTLRVEAARAGSEVKGFVPDGGKLRVTVVTQP